MGKRGRPTPIALPADVAARLERQRANEPSNLRAFAVEQTLNCRSQLEDLDEQIGRALSALGESAAGVEVLTQLRERIRAVLREVAVMHGTLLVEIAPAHAEALEKGITGLRKLFAAALAAGKPPSSEGVVVEKTAQPGTCEQVAARATS